MSGTIFADDDGDFERWVTADEVDQPYTGTHLGPPIMGRPISEGARAHSFTLRLDEVRWRKLNSFAKNRRVTRSKLLRDLIDEL